MTTPQPPEAVPMRSIGWSVDAADGVGTTTPADPRDVETIEHLDALIQWHEHDAPEDEAEFFRHDGYVLTIGDLRRSRAALASRTPGERRPPVDEMEAHFLDANQRMGEALVAIGMALGLPRPRTGATWGAPEILAKIAAGAPGEPSPGLAVESSPLYQEALRIIRESWAALPAAVRDEAAKDGATLAGCIRAIPVAAPPLRGDSPEPQVNRASLVPGIEWALFGSEDGEMVSDDSALPVGELRRLLREVWADASTPVPAHPGVARPEPGALAPCGKCRWTQPYISITHGCPEHDDHDGESW